MLYKSLLLLGLSLLFIGPQEEISYIIQLPQVPGEVIAQESATRRQHYLNLLLANPKTGEIPGNIRKKELQFVDQQYLRNPSGLRKQDLVWELGGPFNVGGRTRGLALDILNEDVIVAGGVSGGMWKSEDSGISWVRTSDPQNRNSISCLTQDKRPGKEHNWYHGTGELVGNSARSIGAAYRGTGIYHSSDNANSWNIISSTNDALPDVFSSQFQYVWNIEVNRNKQDVDELFAATYGGILRSQDGGNTWEVVLGEKQFDLPDTVNLNLSTSPFYTSLVQTDKGYFIAAISSASSSGDLYDNAGLYFSTDGENWSLINTRIFPNYHERTVIGVDEDNDIFYFFTNGDLPLLFRYQLESLNDGVPNGSFQSLTNNLPDFSGIGNVDVQFGYNMVISVHPANPEVVYLGATNLYRSTDGFRSNRNIDWIGGYQSDGARYPGHHPDQHVVVFYPSDPSRMLTGNDGGIRVTNNNLADSVRWASLNNGYLSAQYFSIAQQRTVASELVIGGMQDNGTYIRQAIGENPSWNRIVGGDGGYSALTPEQGLTYISFQDSQIYRILVDGTGRSLSFARVDPTDGGEVQPYLFINPYVLDPHNANMMYLLGGDVIWKNLNLLQIPAGRQVKTPVNWFEIDDTEIRTGVYTALNKSISGDVLYAGYTDTRPGLIKVEEASLFESETVSRIVSPLFPEDSHISCIAINPVDANEIMVVFSNYEIPSLFHSLDGGLSFVDVSGSLEEFQNGEGSGPSTRWVEIVPTNTGNLYFVGTSTGLYSSSNLDGQATVWNPEARESIGNSVVVMMDYRMIDGKLVLATHGNGTFLTFIDDHLPPTLPEYPGVSLAQNFPNPFQDQTIINYNIPEDGIVKIELIDRSGKLIRNLLWAPQYAGQNSISWDGRNNAGVRVDPGMYYYRLSFGRQMKTKRISLLPY